MRDPTLVPPTLVDAVRALADDTARGFVFVRPDGTERFCSFHDIADEAERRGAHLAARGLAQGRPPRHGRARRRRVRPLVPGRALRGRRARPDLPAALVQERRRATTTPSRTSRAPRARDAPDDRRHPAVRRAGRCAGSTTLRVDRDRRRAAPAPPPGTLDVERRRPTTSRSSSSRAAARRAPRASWSPTATSPPTPRRSCSTASARTPPSTRG